MKTHAGSCHCGRVAFSVEADITEALECNCSICRRNGYLLAFVPAAQVDVHTGAGGMTEYTFNRHVIRHRFCPVCGVSLFGVGTDPQGNPMVGVNVRVLADVELSSLAIKPFDGARL